MTLIAVPDEAAVFAVLESEVRSYCRQWPVIFERARGAWLYDRHGRGYLDFFAGAGTLNYGHNDPRHESAARVPRRRPPRALLDMFTTAKAEFLATFADMRPARRAGSPTGCSFPARAAASAVEAALKVARKATGRTEVVYFTGRSTA